MKLNFSFKKGSIIQVKVVNYFGNFMEKKFIMMKFMGNQFTNTYSKKGHISTLYYIKKEFWNSISQIIFVSP